MKIKRFRAQAFTLVEVMVATTILGAGIIGAVAAISLSSRAAGSSFRLAEAANLASNRIALAIAGERAQRGEEGPYRWDLTVEEKDNGLRMARVEVTWQQQGEQLSYTLHELFLQRQPRQE